MLRQKCDFYLVSRSQKHEVLDLEVPECHFDETDILGS